MPSSQSGEFTSLDTPEIVIDNIMSITPAVKGIRLAHATLEQKRKVAESHPRWYFNTRPHEFVLLRPEWISTYVPEWMATYYPREICRIRPVWVANNHPAILASHDMEALLEHNPSWALTNCLNQIRYRYPQALSNYDAGMIDGYKYDKHGGVVRKSKLQLFFGVISRFLNGRRSDGGDEFLPGEVEQITSADFS